MVKLLIISVTHHTACNRVIDIVFRHVALITIKDVVNCLLHLAIISSVNIRVKMQKLKEIKVKIQCSP
jgi:hypothetical protein